MTKVEEFFNDRFGDSVKSMTEGQMLELLKELSVTPHWIAILKYQQARRAVAAGSLCTLDPVANPTLIARTQGAMSGLSDLEEIVFTLNNPEVDQED